MMGKSAVRLLLILLVLTLSGSARAGSLPDPQPVLRVEAGTHLAAIKRVAVSADGRLLATASEDKTARLWNLANGQLIRTFRVPLEAGNPGKLHAVALSPDGSMLAAGGWDAFADASGRNEHSVYIFATGDGRLIKRLGPLPDVVLDLAFSKDGLWLAAGLGHGGVRRWSASGEFAAPPQGDTGYRQSVYSIDFDADGRLAAASLDGKIRVYDRGAESGARLRPLRSARTPDGRAPVSIAYSPDGRLIAVNYIDSNAISILDSSTLRPLGGRRVDTGFLGTRGTYAVAWSSDGGTLYAGGNYEADKALQIIAWPEGGFGAPRILGGPIDAILDLQSLPNGGVAWSASDGEFGLIAGPDGGGGLVKPASADFRAKLGDSFLVSPDASAVRVGLSYGAGDPWSLNVPDLTLTESPSPPGDWLAPLTDLLPASGWVNGASPVIAGRRLPLRDNETVRSLAMAPDGKSYVLGTDFSIYRLSAAGKVLWRVQPEAAAYGVNLSADGEILVAALGDGTIRWYRAMDGAELLAFFVNVPDKRWVMWTPSGYYAASSGGENLVGWQVNQSSWDLPPDFYPVSRFRERYYRPDIVRLVLATRDERAAVAAANINAQRHDAEPPLSQADLPPVVTISGGPLGLTTDEREVEVRYTIRAPSGRPVTQLEVRVDGQLVQTLVPRGFSEATSPDDGSSALTVPVPGHDCDVTLVAYHGDQASAPARLRVHWTGPVQKSVDRRLFALLVGVSTYDDPQLTLHYASKDASDLAAALATQKGKFFSDVTSTLLLDKAATKEAFFSALSNIQREAGADDYILVFLAGHGTTKQNMFYFLPSNAAVSDGRAAETALAGHQLAVQLGRMRGKVLLFVDACYSANALRFDIPGFVNTITGEENAVMMYSSSSANEVSYEGAEWQNGAFTEALLAILADPASYDENGTIVSDKLAVELRRKVSALTAGRQTPIGRSSDAVPPFPVAGR